MKNSTIKTIYAILTGANTDEAEKLAVIRELEDDFAKQAERLLPSWTPMKLFTM